MSEDFFAGMYSGNSLTADIDTFFQDDQSLEGDYYKSVRQLVKASQEEGRLSAFDLPLEAGTRVSFLTDLDSVLTYTDYPGEDMGGTVVTVRSASGDGTYNDGLVHVLWDDGRFRSIAARHMQLEKRPIKRAKTGDPIRIVTSNLGDLSHFFVQAQSRPNELIHKATQDLWSFRKDGDNYVIERLFDMNGDPLQG
jgi:hypothetical protein